MTSRNATIWNAPTGGTYSTNGYNIGASAPGYVGSITTTYGSNITSCVKVNFSTTPTGTGRSGFDSLSGGTDVFSGFATGNSTTNFTYGYYSGVIRTSGKAMSTGTQHRLCFWFDGAGNSQHIIDGSTYNYTTASHNTIGQYFIGGFGQALNVAVTYSDFKAWNGKYAEEPVATTGLPCYAPLKPGNWTALPPGFSCNIPPGVFT